VDIAFLASGLSSQQQRPESLSLEANYAPAEGKGISQLAVLTRPKLLANLCW
jgi:hypothetical protein